MENKQFSSMRKPDEKDVADVATIASMSDSSHSNGCGFPPTWELTAYVPFEKVLP